ncbi:hypothetical protein M569_12202, partial [Genlisea aurea]
FFLLLLLLLNAIPRVSSGDAESLLALKASIDPRGILPWSVGTDFCKWRGVKQCLNGRVTKLVVERLNLSGGTIDGKILNRLDQLRVLSFKGDSLSGQIPDLNGLPNLKSLFLSDNRLSGGIPPSLPLLHRLKVIALNGNQLSGKIPATLSGSGRLYALYLQDNRFTGDIPPLNQTTLRFFNVSNNALSGRIPVTAALARFNSSSFSGNANLCGDPIHRQCSFAPSLSPSPSPSPSPAPSNNPPESRHQIQRHNKKLLILILVPSVAFFALSVLCIAFIFLAMLSRKGREAAGGGQRKAAESDDGGKGFSWDEEGGGGSSSEGLGGSLVFLGPGDQLMSYTLEDLLKASAETLGRGTIGSTYKAVMESGYIVTVKRLRDGGYPSMDEFRTQIEVVGRLRHPNLVPLRAYFQTKDERLLVYDYFPNGSLFSLLHGSRASGSKPLHWTSCLKIAEDLAAGLAYIHHNPTGLLLTHGNLKSTNVLLGTDFESCLTDYGLNPFSNPDSDEETSASSLFYRAPECRDVRNAPSAATQPADVYSYGVVLLELLTGKTPFQDLVEEHGRDIPKWVRAVREDGNNSDQGGEEPGGSRDEVGEEEKLNGILDAAMACLSLVPSERPSMRDVLRMIRETRAEESHRAVSSNNSSDHSPGRWSDSVQSVPREDQHLRI